MKVLKANPGYILHNKENDTYTSEVYMPDTADESIYEEVLREDADPVLYQAVEELKDENTEQNDILDISMMAIDDTYTEYGALVDDILLAIDELFTIIEPLLGGEGGE